MYLALRQSIIIIAINMASSDTGNGRTKEKAKPIPMYIPIHKNMFPK